VRVIFLKEVPNVGREGEAKEVSDGYATNFLLPKKLAVKASPDMQSKYEAQKRAEAKKLAVAEAEAQALADKIKGKTFTLSGKTGGGERLYGAITAADVAAVLSKAAGATIDKRKVELPEAIRKLGTYDVTVKLYAGIAPTVKVKVIPQEG
jgi:large subunit ribosomal protein L9